MSNFNYDGKSAQQVLNEYLQKKRRPAASYEIRRNGPDHEPWFDAVLNIERQTFEGQGSTKQIAKEAAAAAFVEEVLVIH